MATRRKMTFYLAEHLADAVEDYADEHGMSASQVTARAVREFLIAEYRKLEALGEVDSQGNRN